MPLSFFKNSCRLRVFMSSFRPWLLSWRNVDANQPSACSLRNLKMYNTKGPGQPFFADVPPVTKDVLLYKFDSHRFHCWMTIFGASQCVFWNYLAIFVQQCMTDAGPSEEKETSTTQARPIVYKVKELLNFDNKYKHGISFLFSVLGCGFMLVTSLLALRSVQMVVLRKGGQTVDVVTSALFGSRRTLSDLPLDHVSCQASVHGRRGALPLKLKGRSFFFLLDTRGTFPDRKLFQQTVGLHRNLKRSA